MQHSIHEAVKENAALLAKTKPEYPPQWTEGYALAASEGGFRKGDRIRIMDPYDFYCGQNGTCGEVPSERTVFVVLDCGKTFRYCVSSLTPA